MGALSIWTARGEGALMKWGVLALVIGLAPGAAVAANYVSLSIDRKTLAVTDIRTPRQIGTQAQTFEVVIYRELTKVPKGKIKASYTISEIDFDCTTGKTKRAYAAHYGPGGEFVASDVAQKPWAKVKPGSTEEALANLGCHGVKPAGFVLGDVLLRKVMADYRAGGYDRFIH
jgi:hypothetical protein